MNVPNDPNASGIPDYVTSTAPSGDHPLTSEHLVVSAVSLITQALTDITDVLEVHADMAPTTALRVIDLAGTVATETSDWLHRWQ
ncbi:hypothetical protein [Nocardia sp. alder85J]|uniref:hypothetical protein n=1 Tax=Nocardia sp. alder85J TaxID=2862949 RepID=UPI001CD1AB27|nr:hypothetical protein [Nocardia sp. alder85J]MCX4098054.1 hypothetical protein [Nocardia sp. alder85J]